MQEADQRFDDHRYRRLLEEADDEPKRLALIRLLIEERAMARLAASQVSGSVVPGDRYRQ